MCFTKSGAFIRTLCIFAANQVQSILCYTSDKVRDNRDILFATAVDSIQISVQAFEKFWIFTRRKSDKVIFYWWKFITLKLTSTSAAASFCPEHCECQSNYPPWWCNTWWRWDRCCWHIWPLPVGFQLLLGCGNIFWKPDSSASRLVHRKPACWVQRNTCSCISPLEPDID